MSDQQTIVALASGSLPSAVAILRISGPAALPTLKEIFIPRGRDPHTHYVHRHLMLGDLVYTLPSGERSQLDHIMVAVMYGPHSFTGEDCVELYLHGGVFVVDTTFEVLRSFGIRSAQPGEFTRRAFLAGKVDLAQAEAIQQLVRAESEDEHRSVMRVLLGELSGAVERVREDLLELLSWLELRVDFGDEDVVPLSDEEVARRLVTHIDTVSALVVSTRGDVRTSEHRVVLTGPPNSGKSSLLNRLVGFERSLVSPWAGTTRDVVEVRLESEGMRMALIDTAGIRTGAEELERLGIERAHSAREAADLLVYVMNASLEIDPDNWTDFLDCVSKWNTMLVLNFSDRGLSRSGAAVMDSGRTDLYHVSALTGEGLTLLRVGLVQQLKQVSQHNTRWRVAQWQLDELRAVVTFLEEALNSLSLGLSPEAMAASVMDALRALDHFSGRDASADLLDQIFSRFCLGK